MEDTLTRCFEFRFTRRGQTNLWELDSALFGREPAGTGEDGEARLGQNDDKTAWIDVFIRVSASDMSSDDERDAHYERAEKLAVAKFKERHPEAEVLD